MNGKLHVNPDGLRRVFRQVTLPRRVTVGVAVAGLLFAGACSSTTRETSVPSHSSYLARLKTGALFIALDRDRSTLKGTITIARLVENGTRVEVSTSGADGTVGPSGVRLVAFGADRSGASVRVTSQKGNLEGQYVASHGDRAARIIFEPAKAADYGHALKLLRTTAARQGKSADVRSKRDAMAKTRVAAALSVDASALTNSAAGLATGTSNLQDDFALTRQDAVKSQALSGSPNSTRACSAFGVVREDDQAVSDDAQFVEGFITGLRSDVATVRLDESKVKSAYERSRRDGSSSALAGGATKALADGNRSIAVAHSDAVNAVKQANRTVESARSVANNVLAVLKCGSAVPMTKPLPQPDF